MSSPLANEFEELSQMLSTSLPNAAGGAFVSSGLVGADIYQDYNHRYETFETSQVDVGMLVFTNKTGSGSLALVPVALFEQGEILATLTLSGTLAESLRGTVLEVLALRDQRWLCVDSKPLPTGRFATRKLEDVLRPVLST